jgi:hypothetical protein
MDLVIKHNGKQVQDVLDQLGHDQLPFATALAVTRTAQLAKTAIWLGMRESFDRPTSFTLNSLFLKSATKVKPVAEIRVKDEASKSVPPSKWLAPEIYGGARNAKRFEQRLRYAGILGPNQYALPGGAAKLDAYGNMSKGQLVAILSDLQAHFDPKANSTAKSRKSRERRNSRQGKSGGVYFAVTTRRGALRPGVYERTSFGFGSSARPVLIFTDKAPTYQKRLKFLETAQDVVAKRYAGEFADAMREAVATAITKRAAA